MRGARHPRTFTEEFKRQIVDLYNNGKRVSEIGAEYDPSHSAVHRWARQINS